MSGKRERGGPGHQVAKARLMPAGEMTPERRAALKVVLLRANGGRPQELSAAIDALRAAQREQGQATIPEALVLRG